MNNDLISRSALIAEIERDIDFEIENNAPITAIDAFKIAIKRAKKLPTMGAEPVRHDYWLPQNNIRTKLMFSDCKSRNHDGSGKYCSNYGAKMRGNEYE